MIDAGAVAVYVAAVSMDMASTELALASNLHAYEGNPLLREPTIRIGVGYVGRTVVLVAMDHSVKKRWGKRAAKRMRVIVFALHFALAVNNLRHVR